MIRQANAEDYESIHTLSEKELGYPCDKELVHKRLSNIELDRECVFVAVMDDRVVGFIHVEKYETLYIPAMANILGIAVAGSYQRQGIGRALLEEAEKWAEKKGMNAMRLHSGDTRKEAHKFYRNLGYRNEKKQIRFLKPLQTGDAAYGKEI